jgi:hypothetical protein
MVGLSKASKYDSTELSKNTVENELLQEERPPAFKTD